MHYPYQKNERALPVNLQNGDILSFVPPNIKPSLPPQFLSFLSISLESRRMVIPEFLFLYGISSQPCQLLHFYSVMQKYPSQVGFMVGSLWMVVQVRRVLVMSVGLLCV